MEEISKFRRRKSIRLAGWDYTEGASYDVTIVTKDRVSFFGTVVAAEMDLSPLGMAANACWREIPQHHEGVTLDEFVIMPNHLHGIIVINERRPRDDNGDSRRGRSIERPQWCKP